MRCIKITAMTSFIIIILAACTTAPQETQINSNFINSSAQQVSQGSDDGEIKPKSHTEWLRYETLDDFHNAILNSKTTYRNAGTKSIENINDINWYFDFADIVNDVVLDEVRVNSTYVTLEYGDKEKEESETLLIRCARWEEFDANEYINKTRSNAKNVSTDIEINGNNAIKQEVYWNNEFWVNKHMCNQYFWVENGTAIFLRVPAWLLEIYPEETFFNIEKVDVKKN